MDLGDTIVLKATPGLILAINEKTEAFIKGLVEAEAVDLERECMAFSRDMVVMLGEYCKTQQDPPENKTNEESKTH